MLFVRIGNSLEAEKRYIFKQVFDGFLGLEYRVEFVEGNENYTICEEGNNRQLEFKDCFFSQFEERAKWLSSNSLPNRPLSILRNTQLLSRDPASDGLPVLYGSQDVVLQDDTIKMGVDLFGSCFFMLSRYEEMVCMDRDEHGRFPVSACIAHKEGFLNRPLVDEYTELLWKAIQVLWPHIERKTARTKKYISCDVDHIHDYGIRFPNIVKRLGADLLVRKSLKAFLRSARSFFQVFVLRQKEKDPFNTFNFMMDVCEGQNLNMAFYFIPRNDKKAIDGEYDIESEEVKVLMQKIIARGHEIGYHASYYSYNKKEIMLDEVEILKRAYRTAGGNPKQLQGGRQHYLRWQTGITEKNWEAAGLAYDSTLGYAESIGFRCGTSKEYDTYDLVERKNLKLKIRPLLVMDVSMLSTKYMGLDHKAAFEAATKIWDSTRRYNGNFTLLWHNSFLDTRDKMELFKRIVGLS